METYRKYENQMAFSPVSFVFLYLTCQFLRQIGILLLKREGNFLDFVGSILKKKKSNTLYRSLRMMAKDHLLW